jgi:dCMP deaminase
VIFTTGIRKVFYKHSYAAFKGLASDEGVDFLKRFGVQVVQYNQVASS